MNIREAHWRAVAGNPGFPRATREMASRKATEAQRQASADQVRQDVGSSIGALSQGDIENIIKAREALQ